MRPIVILGATATGKTDLAIGLAQRLRARIISADSVQVYRGLDIGSCKPTAKIRARIRHELIDVVGPQEPFSAGRFAREATEAIDSCRRQGVVPIIAGGTGLYIRALLCGLAPMPARDDAVRRKLYGKARASTSVALHEELRICDPESALRIGPHDLQRIVRALEVMELTGMPLSHHIRTRSFQPDLFPTLKIGLTMGREMLYHRINDRVDGIFRAGIVEEVGGLLSSGVPPECNSLKALGYREVVEYLRGQMDLRRTVELVKRNTRRYARRQTSWFRRERGVHWLAIDGEVDDSRQLVKRVLELHDNIKGGCVMEPKRHDDGR